MKLSMTCEVWGLPAHQLWTGTTTSYQVGCDLQASLPMQWLALCYLEAICDEDKLGVLRDEDKLGVLQPCHFSNNTD